MAHTLVLNMDWSPVSVLPLSTLNWQDAIKAIYLGTVRTIHTYSNWIVSSPSSAYEVPSVVVTMKHVRVRRSMAFSDEMIFLRDHYTCQYCGLRFPSSKLTLDHVVPKSFGGKLVWTNTAAACSPCNSRRGNNQKIQPKTAPYRPTYQELATKRRSYRVTIPHAAWIPYIGWDEKLVRIEQPASEPGYVPLSEPKRMLRSLLLQEE